MKHNNETIREAVKAWLKDQESAEEKYGHISRWDTSKVTDMSELFSGAHDFDESLNDWDVSNATTMQTMFSGAKSFNQPLEKWDVSNVSNMEVMFRLATSFNQPIGDWDVSNVSNMEEMFYEAKSFNQPIGDWDVSNVTIMKDMFSWAKSFNQVNIDEWSISESSKKEIMFDNYTIRSCMGSIFDTKDLGLEAIIVFVPSGLTALRAYTLDFLGSFGKQIDKKGEFLLFENNPNIDKARSIFKWEPSNQLKYALVDRNKNQKTYERHDISSMVDYALRTMSELGVKVIGMNGIRTRGSFWGTPEEILYREIVEWLANNEHSFQTINLIDLRGGFSRVC